MSCKLDISATGDSSDAGRAVMNTDVQISLSDPPFNSFYYISKSGIAGSYMVIVFLICWGTAIVLFSATAVPFYFPANNAHGF